MGYASRSGRARTSITSPQAHAICDRCGFRYNHVDLRWQYDWRGAALQNLRILVCNTCYDTPQEQLRAIVVPADPVPIMNARTENFANAETDYVTIASPPVYDAKTGILLPPTKTLSTQDGVNLTMQPVGNPLGLNQNAITPSIRIPAISVTSNGKTIITVTCLTPHGLSNNSQVSVDGLSENGANGFYSVIILTATAFTYMTNAAINAGALLTANSRIVIANVGVPYNYPQLPQTGPR